MHPQKILQKKLEKPARKSDRGGGKGLKSPNAAGASMRRGSARAADVVAPALAEPRGGPPVRGLRHGGSAAMPTSSLTTPAPWDVAVVADRARQRAADIARTTGSAAGRSSRTVVKTPTKVHLETLTVPERIFLFCVAGAAFPKPK